MNDKVWCLTHTKPRKFLKLPGAVVQGTYWRTNPTETIYLTEAVASTVRRYNNNSGGSLMLTPDLAIKLQQFIGCSYDSFIIKITNVKMLKHTLFISELPFPESQEAMGITGDHLIVRIGTDEPLKPEELFAKLLTFDPVEDAEKLALPGAQTALRYFKGLTLSVGILQIPAFEEAAAAEALARVPTDKIDELLPKLKLVLENNPTTNEAAGDALLEIAAELGLEPNLEVYTPAAPEDVAALAPDSEPKAPEGTSEEEAPAAPEAPVVAETAAPIDSPAPAEGEESNEVAIAPHVDAALPALPMTHKEKLLIRRLNTSSRNLATLMAAMLQELQSNLEVEQEVLAEEEEA